MKNRNLLTERLCERLVDCLGEENVLREPRVLESYCFDGLRPYRGYPVPSHGFPPDFVVTPGSTEEVVKVVQAAAEFGVPLVAYGGGTGLMGGSVAYRGGGLVDLRRMNRILRIDDVDQLVEVQAGATLAAVDQALREKGLMLGHDPWTKAYATVGGAIATNGLGYLAGKYGSMGDQVLALEVVLPDGSAVKTRGVPQSSTGLDLKRLFIGTEGTLGIITSATLCCYPCPEEERVYAYTFPRFEEAFQAALAMLRIGLNPASLDVGGSDPEGPSDFYMVLTGFVEEVEAAEARSRSILSAHGGGELGEAEAKSYWENRYERAHRYVQWASKSPLAHWRREKSFDFLHVALPVSRVLSYWRRCLATVNHYGLKVRNFGIWIKPQFFSIALLREEHVPPENLEKAVNEGLLLALQLGGSCEYCHGVGIRLAHLMLDEHASGLAVMKKVKGALDPRHLINPGKLGL